MAILKNFLEIGIKNKKYDLSYLKKYELRNSKQKIQDEKKENISNDVKELVDYHFESKTYYPRQRGFVSLAFYQGENAKKVMFEEEQYENEYFYCMMDKSMRIYIYTNKYRVTISPHRGANFFDVKQISQRENNTRLDTYKNAIRVPSNLFHLQMKGEKIKTNGIVSNSEYVSFLNAIYNYYREGQEVNSEVRYQFKKYEKEMSFLLDVLSLKNDFDTLERPYLSYQSIERTTLTGITGVFYQFHIAESISSIFAEGVIVTVAQDDQSESFTDAAYIVSVNNEEKTICLKFKQTDLSSLPHQGIIKPVDNNVIYNTQRNAIEKLMNGEATNKNILDIIYNGKVKPAIISNEKDYPGKTNKQKEAINKAVECDDFMLVQGPPGTGKTTIIIEMIKEFVASGKKVLITSKNNLAVDNVLDKCMDKDIKCIRLGREESVKVEKVKSILPDRAIITMEQKIADNIEEQLKGDQSDYFSSIKEQCQYLSQLAQLFDDYKDIYMRYKTLSLQCETLQNRCENTIVKMINDNAFEQYFDDYRLKLKETYRQLLQKKDIMNELCQHTSLNLGQIEEYLDVNMILDEKNKLIDDMNYVNARQEIQKQWYEDLNTRKESLEQVLMDGIQVYGATCIGVNTAKLFKNIEYDVVIVDESGQIPIFDILVPLSKAKKVILIGDHKQLPPGGENDFYQYLDKRFENDELTISSEKVKKLFEVSLFEELYYKIPETNKVMLDTQYRMHQDIANYISQFFYNNSYYTGCKNDDRLLSLGGYHQPMYFIDTINDIRKYENIRFNEDNLKQYSNHLEAKIISDIIVKMIKDLPTTVKDFNGDKKINIEDIGIITPYKEQKRVIKEILFKELELQLKYPKDVVQSIIKRIDIATVDSFQGRDKEIIFYSFTRSNKKHKIGFLCELRRLNVSITRAKRMIIMVGDSETLTKTIEPTTIDYDQPCSYYFENLIQYCQSHHFYDAYIEGSDN